jgi:hypothetical protein
MQGGNDGDAYGAAGTVPGVLHGRFAARSRQGCARTAPLGRARCIHRCLVAEGFIQLGGPLDEEGGGFLVVRAQNEVEARERLRHDPWYAHDILCLVWVKRWRILIDTWQATSGA